MGCFFLEKNIRIQPLNNDKKYGRTIVDVNRIIIGINRFSDDIIP